jgi:hypothetical protein
MKNKTKFQVMFLVFICLFLNTGVLYAYLDPGSISIFFQVIAGGLVGIFIGIKVFGHSILKFFKKLFGIKSSSNENPENSEKK